MKHGGGAVFSGFDTLHGFADFRQVRFKCGTYLGRVQAYNHGLHLAKSDAHVADLLGVGILSKVDLTV